MEREHWSELSEAISAVQASWRESRRFRHPTALIVRVHLWAVLHDRPMLWACCAQNWDGRRRGQSLPDQSTMSRRTRGAQGKGFEAFLNAVAARMNRRTSQQQPMRLLKWMDGKALPVASHSKDPNARWGRGAGQQSNGYKLHVIGSDLPMPERWALTPLDVDERHMARRMIKGLEGTGYLLRDGLYDASDLFDRSAAVNHQMAGPRRMPGTGLGHCYQSPHRIRAIEMMEPPAGVNCFGQQLYRGRLQAERNFGNLVCFGGGLQCLPPWVRRIWRVRNWVYGKLLINAARVRLLRQRQETHA